MSYETFFPETIEMQLNGIEETASHYPESQFKLGFMACLAVIRASFGLAQSVLVIPMDHETIHGASFARRLRDE